MRSGRVLPWVVMLCALVSTPAFPQEWLTVEGLIDGEAFKTDAGSRLLSRNQGDPVAPGRLQLWAAAEAHAHLHFFVLGEVESAIGENDGETEAAIEQGFLRYTSPHHVVVELGRITTPVGAFSGRHFSNVNPLIGAPDTYDVSYPYGVKVAGFVSRLDYRAALVDLPVTNEKYLPPPGNAYRPALGGGVTLITGLRLGASMTRGPYLHRNLTAMLPSGTRWRDYQQKIVGLDVQFSRGYMELHGEWIRSRYDVPTHTQAVRGVASYADLKYTWTPRFFTAVRLEKNEYAYIEPVNPNYWHGEATSFYDVEAGVGYRFGPDTLLKASYRRDRWMVDEYLATTLPDGYAFAVQISHQFDVKSWFERPH